VSKDFTYQPSRLDGRKLSLCKIDDFLRRQANCFGKWITHREPGRVVAMTKNERTQCLALLAGFPAGLAVAAPDEGDGFRNIAALLVLLGIGA
jgi:hypothetical protein